MASENFQKQFIGILGQGALSNSAYNIALVCLTWYVFAFTGSATDVGLIAIVETLSTLLVSLPVGALIDRHNKAVLLIISSLLGFFVFLLMTLVSLVLRFDLFIMLALVALWGLGRAISRSAEFAIIPDLVQPGVLSRANGVFRALNSSMGSVSNAAAGAIILLMGASSGFAISSGSYLISSLLIVLLVLPAYKLASGVSASSNLEKSSMFSDISEGFTWLVKRKGFFLLTLCATFFNFFIDMTLTFLVVYVVDGIHASSLVFGFALAALAAGDVVGSLIPGRLNLLKHTGKINVIFFGVMAGFAILIAGLFPSSFTAVLSPFIMGMSVGIAVNLWLTSAHNLVPKEMRGRYFTLDGVLSSITPAGIATGALVISLVGVINDFIISGVALLLTGVIFSLMKSLWNLDGRSPDSELPV